MLAEVGIIETRQGKGGFVAVDGRSLAPDVATAEKQAEYYRNFLDSTQARLLLEPALARQAAKNAVPEDLARREAILCRKRKRAVGEDAFEEFHQAVARAAGNPLLEKFLDQLLALEQQGRSAFFLPLPEDQKRTSGILCEHHRKIFQAIRDGDPEFAYFYMKEHPLYLMKVYQ